jgi:phytoene synthase
LKQNTPQHPVTQALQPFIRGFNIDTQYLQLIIDGMQMDLEQTRYLDFDSLRKYCYHVAGVVGLVSARIFGVTQPQTLQYAETLGLAFQLTNILRDVGEDARQGRVYLPEQDMERYGVTRAQLMRCEANESFRALMQFETERAQALYQQAFALLPVEDKKAQRPGLIMAAIYRTLLDEIARDNFPVLTHRVSLTPLRKLWLAWRTWVFG